MTLPRIWQPALLAAALLTPPCLADGTATTIQVDDCRADSKRIEATEASVGAEINAHGDLLLLVETDGDGRRDQAFVAALESPASAHSLVDSINAAGRPIKVVAALSEADISQAIVLSLPEGEKRWVLATKPERCATDGGRSDHRLEALAHYRFGDSPRQTRSTIESLRDSPLISKRD